MVFPTKIELALKTRPINQQFLSASKTRNISSSVKNARFDQKGIQFRHCGHYKNVSKCRRNEIQSTSNCLGCDSTKKSRAPDIALPEIRRCRTNLECGVEERELQIIYINEKMLTSEELKELMERSAEPADNMRTKRKTHPAK